MKTFFLICSRSSLQSNLVLMYPPIPYQHLSQILPFLYCSSTPTLIWYRKAGDSKPKCGSIKLVWENLNTSEHFTLKHLNYKSVWPLNWNFLLRFNEGLMVQKPVLSTLKNEFAMFRSPPFFHDKFQQIFQVPFSEFY